MVLLYCLLLGVSGCVVNKSDTTVSVKLVKSVCENFHQNYVDELIHYDSDGLVSDIGEHSICSIIKLNSDYKIDKLMDSKNYIGFVKLSDQKVHLPRIGCITDIYDNEGHLFLNLINYHNIEDADGNPHLIGITYDIVVIINDNLYVYSYSS